MSTETVKVAFVDHTSERGGAELALARLLSTHQSWQASLIVPRARARAEDAFHAIPHTVSQRRVGPAHSSLTTSRHRVLSSIGLAFKLFASTVSLLLTSDARRSDVLVANTTRSSVYVTAAGAILRKPVVVHIRDLVEPGAIGGAGTRLMRSFVLPRASALIANSAASLALVDPYRNDRCRTAVIASTSGIVPIHEGKVSAAPKVKKIGIVARLDPWKGQDLLIAAFAAAGLNTKLLLIGGASFGHDEYVKRLHDLADQLGVSEAVQFVGHVQDVPSMIAELDVCVQYSVRAEPLGQNVLQYLAAGKPTIVANEGGPAEWVKNEVNGLAVPPRDVSALALALERICGDAALRMRLAVNAAQTPGLATDQEIGERVLDLLEAVAS